MSTAPSAEKVMCTKGITVACIKAVSGGCNPGECITGAEGAVISLSDLAKATSDSAPTPQQVQGMDSTMGALS